MQRENRKARRRLSSLCQLREEPAGAYANARVPARQEIQIQPEHVSALALCGLLSRFIIHFQTSLVAPGHIRGEQRRETSLRVRAEQRDRLEWQRSHFSFARSLADEPETPPAQRNDGDVMQLMTERYLF